ncbi:MAG: hypothetical protein JSU66_04040 [Deltaproteobacteria bacterium]|nr:MAG: hypothetical protein JSU66_04040 [Deltaproteobacteria bacterium]
MTLLCVGGARARAQVEYAQTVINAFKIYSDSQIVDVFRDFPTFYVQPQVADGFPIGHPALSNLDCVANPTSQGCRARDVLALAASQGVTPGTLCVSFRPYAYIKRVDSAVDTIDGVPFDRQWLMRVPGDVFESYLARWPNGIFYPSHIDGAWVEQDESACCHDGIGQNCTSADLCVGRYGRGNDVEQRFETTFALVDLRIPELRAWMAGKVVAKMADTTSSCAAVAYKPAWLEFYDGPNIGRECWEEGGNAVQGPTRAYDPCASIGGTLSRTPYGPQEYQDALNAFFAELFVRLDEAGVAAPSVVTVERPWPAGGNGSWMDEAVRSSPQLAGEIKNDITPFLPPPPPSVSVYLNPPPTGGKAPLLDVHLVLDARGSAKGPIDYHVWCDCPDGTSDVAAAQASCGTAPGAYHSVFGTELTTVVLANACDYEAAGLYVPKVIAVREGATDEDRIALDVCDGASCEACRDGIDNDLDGSADHPADPGCASPTDPSERSPFLPCDDGIDNDGDGHTDVGDDPACQTPASWREDPRCDDGIDNDRDGQIDWDGDIEGSGDGPAAADVDCSDTPWRNAETSGRRRGCGLGFELAPLLPMLARLRRRSRRRSSGFATS